MNRYKESSKFYVANPFEERTYENLTPKQVVFLEVTTGYDFTKKQIELIDSAIEQSFCTALIKIFAKPDMSINEMKKIIDRLQSYIDE